MSTPIDNVAMAREILKVDQSPEELKVANDLMDKGMEQQAKVTSSKKIASKSDACKTTLGSNPKKSMADLETMNLIQDPPPSEGEMPTTGQTLFPLIPSRSITVNRESLLQGRRQRNPLHAGKEVVRQASTLHVAMICLRLRPIMINPTVGS